MPRVGGAGVLRTLLADLRYDGYLAREQRQIEELTKEESLPLTVDWDTHEMPGLRNEARQVLLKFRPATLGQASRLAGVTPADLMLVRIALTRRGAGSKAAG